LVYVKTAAFWLGFEKSEKSNVGGSPKVQGLPTPF
jgi:hypothetical protein